jgi:hypothetical protein
MFYSTLVAYACFKKITLFRDILYRFTEMSISMMFYDDQQKNCIHEILFSWVWFRHERDCHWRENEQVGMILNSNSIGFENTVDYHS